MTTVCDVSPIIPRGKTEPLFDYSICLAVVGKGKKNCLQSVKIEETDACTVYIMGDSTVTDQTADFPYAPGACYSEFYAFTAWKFPPGMFLFFVNVRKPFK